MHDGKTIASLAVLMLTTVAFALAPAATAYGVGCNGTKTTKGNATQERQSCTVAVGEGGYVLCLGYSMYRASGGDQDPSETTQCANGVKPSQGTAPPTVESPLLP